MELTKNKTMNFILVNVVLPVVLSLIVAFAFEKMRAKNETKKKVADVPPKKVEETIEEEEVAQAA